MPLFMDLHISPSGDIPIDELIEKHKSDIAVQHKYGVEFQSMWVNKEKGMVFCLMEGPDKEACVNVHQRAHGDTGCNIIEVNPGDYDKFLASSLPNTDDIAETETGIMDTAYRTVLRFEIIDPLNRRKVRIQKIKQLIKKNKGSLLLDPYRSIKAVFIYPSAAFHSAGQIRDFIGEHLDYRLSIVSGKPVEKDHDKFYGYVTDLSDKISICAKKGRIRTTMLTMDLLRKEGAKENRLLKYTDILSHQEEQFLNQLLDLILKNFSVPDFNATELAAMILLSRSQLFKKTKKNTGFTPNTLIREIRLYEALKLLDRKKDQIAPIAYDTGFNSPSYFSKVFAKRFHILPSDYLNIL